MAVHTIVVDIAEMFAVAIALYNVVGTTVAFVLAHVLNLVLVVVIVVPIVLVPPIQVEL